MIAEAPMSSQSKFNILGLVVQMITRGQVLRCAEGCAEACASV